MAAPTTYKLTAKPIRLIEGQSIEQLEAVTFTATADSHSCSWLWVNDGSYLRDFEKLVSPELATSIVDRLRRVKR